MGSSDSKYSTPDQPASFAKAKAEQNQRFLDITTVYDGSYLKGMRVGLTGANRGIGLSLAKEVREAPICRGADNLRSSLIHRIEFGLCDSTKVNASAAPLTCH